MTQRSMEVTRFHNAAVALLAAATTFCAMGCDLEFDPPTVVNKLRILTIKPSTPDVLPGQELRLSLLWSDPQPPCSEALPCPAGRSCQDGGCVRDAEHQVLWLVLPMSVWSSTEMDVSGSGGGMEMPFDSCPPQMRCEDSPGCDCDEASGYCVPCMTFGEVTFCCGTYGADTITAPIATSVASQALCDETLGEVGGATIHVMAQVCVGGTFAVPEATGTVRFDCVGEGAETVMATARFPVVGQGERRNETPAIESATFNGQPWDSTQAVEVRGCAENSCADRDCNDETPCTVEGQICHEGKCREALVLTLSDGAEDVFLRTCDSSSPCEEDHNCPAGWACREGGCQRIERAFANFYVTAGTVTPGRVLLDSMDDNDRRPDLDELTSHFLPPVLESCEAQASSQCDLGVCDVESGYCLGEVTLWAVARDGRGGSDWVEQRIRIVP